MDKHTFDVLGFPYVREILAGMCQTDMGRERARALVPAGDRVEVVSALDRLAEIVALPEEPPFVAMPDIRPLLLQLRADGLLSGPELLLVLRACQALRRCSEFLRRHREDLVLTGQLTRGIAPLPGLERELDAALDETGVVRDNASRELAEIRLGLRRKRNALVGRLDRIVAAHPDWFGGATTVRGERHVLPLLLPYRNRLPGVVHGSSGSGQTLFVEPFESVSDGNELQELRDAETEEVARILRALSRSVVQSEGQLESALSAAAELDVLTAKRRFAVRFDCTRARVSDDGRVDVLRGRHPLLVQRGIPVVPLDFHFPETATVVLMSGPNAGGKTVVLKTLGLFSLMLGCGMYLPAADGSSLPVFGQVFADIGDEQSIDSDLSSFTAHIARLKEILEHADGASLVLVDEIGASTAPEEGAALASAVLEALRDAGVRSVVTTHFGALKVFVQDEPGMANAAMEWGMLTLPGGQTRYGPTYRLRMGVPGESSAFEIAAGAGMPAWLLERARNRMGKEWLDLSVKLRSLDDELTKAQTAGRKAKQEMEEAARLRHDNEERAADIRRSAALERERLRCEQESFLLGKRREIENLVRGIREREADHESVVAAKAAVEQGLAAVVAPNEPASDDRPGVTGVSVGDIVSSRTFRKQGRVVEVSGAAAVVAFGHIKMQLELGDLVAVEAAAVQHETVVVPEEPHYFDPRLSIIGMTRDEAMDAVSRFLDEAAMSGAGELLVIHGRGTGVLRRALWDRLKRDVRIEAMKLGEQNEGGSGVTAVTLKYD